MSLPVTATGLAGGRRRCAYCLPGWAEGEIGRYAGEQAASAFLANRPSACYLIRLSAAADARAITPGKAIRNLLDL